jgi:antitoxin (DNA-binding transcriptional repressor) of toxin-antitoxin stability system
MQQISLTDAALDLLSLIEAAQNGEEIILMQDSQPLAKLIALTPADTALSLKRQKRQQMFGSAKDLIQIAADFDEPLAEFEEYLD